MNLQFKIKSFSILFSCALTIVFISVSCSSIKPHQLQGKYVHKEKHPYPRIYSEITFKDTTFTYTFRADLYYKESQGTWHIKGNNIVLKSYDYCKNDYILVNEMHTRKKPYIQVYESGLPYPDIQILINNSENYLTTDAEGRVYYDSSIKINHIQVFSIDLSEEETKYIVKNNKSNVFEIEVFGKNKYTYFDGEKVRVTKNNLRLEGRKYQK